METYDLIPSFRSTGSRLWDLLLDCLSPPRREPECGNQPEDSVFSQERGSDCGNPAFDPSPHFSKIQNKGFIGWIPSFRPCRRQVTICSAEPLISTHRRTGCGDQTVGSSSHCLNSL